jgi:hypothetical protein
MPAHKKKTESDRTLIKKYCFARRSTINQVILGTNPSVQAVSSQ